MRGVADFQALLVRTAALLANDVFARLATNLLKQAVQSQSLSYRVFAREAEVAAWLQQVG